MGRRSSTEEIYSNHHSNYALNEMEPRNSREKIEHYSLLVHNINHGNYIVENIRFEENNNSYFNYCKTCYKYREKGKVPKLRRVSTSCVPIVMIGLLVQNVNLLF